MLCYVIPIHSLYDPYDAMSFEWELWLSRDDVNFADAYWTIPPLCTYTAEAMHE